MLVGEEEVTSERQLTSKVEAGTLMNGVDSVRFIVIHCSATRADRDYTPEQTLKDHKARGFRTIGYHAYIRKDGSVTYHRKWLEVGAHARGYNRCSIGVCYEGGLELVSSDECGVSSVVPADTRTPAQKKSLRELLWKLHKMYPKAQVVGHCELPGVKKACPCFYPSYEYHF